MLLRTDCLMVLLLFLLFHIFLNVTFIGFVSRFFYVVLGMLIISHDSHIYMRKFGLHPHHVILVSSYIADSERLLYEIHFTMTTFTILAYEHFPFCRLLLALVYRNLDKTSLKCCHVYIFIARFNFRNDFFRIVLHFRNEYFF